MPNPLILRLAHAKAVSGLVQRYGPSLGARRFFAGETLADAVRVVAGLSALGIAATVDHLGESVLTAAAARRQADAYVEILQALRAAGLDANVSVKLTQMGLDIGQELCLANMRRIVAAAKAADGFVRIDMEDSAHTDATLDVLRQLRRDYPRVGTVLQAYLYRSQRDLEALLAEGVNVRIVKGAYLEPAQVAFPRKADVDRSYLRLVEFALRSGSHVAVATHDEGIIAQVAQRALAWQVPRERFEFQMLYGIRMARQRALAAQGYRMRCYVPYGTEWYAYFMRRLAERPANILFVLRSLRG